MKNLGLFVIGLCLASGVAQAAPAFWKVDSEKRIYFVPEPVVKVQRDELHADDDYWDRVSVTLSYVGSEVAKQASLLKSENPGWEVSRVVVKQAGNLRLRIPSLGVDSEMNSLPSVDGPYFTQMYYVKKKDSRAVKAALQSPSSFLQLLGAVTASVPKEIVAERAELPGSICRELRRNGSDVYGAILSFPAVEEMINAAAKREENRATLRKMVLSSCLETSGRMRTASFADVLAIPLNELQPDAAFSAELRVTSWQEESLPLGYQTLVGEWE